MHTSKEGAIKITNRILLTNRVNIETTRVSTSVAVGCYRYTYTLVEKIRIVSLVGFKDKLVAIYTKLIDTISTIDRRG